MTTLAIPHVLAASTFTTLVNFTGANGAGPLAGLLQANDGNFYGTTYEGGSAHDGTIFKLTPGGVLTPLFNFQNDANGTGPQGGLIQGKNGNFYGTTSDTVFSITSSGTLVTLARFNLGVSCQAGLIQDSSGNFYGTTYFGGTYGYGNIFKLTPSGTLTTLINFNGTYGDGPNRGGLIQDSTGNLYGTAEGGGSGGYGTVFKVTSTGSLTALANFNQNNGSNPAGVIQASDGNFYGTTKAGGYGGTSNYGTIFELTPTGTLTTLVTFNSVNGTQPQAGVIQGSDGNFYGTTCTGGSSNVGTLFQLVHVLPANYFQLNTLFNFNSASGNQPQSKLIQASDGNFYGTTSSGGSAGFGTVFRFEPTTSENVLFSSASAIPIVASNYSINGSALDLTLDYAPSPGDVLTAVQITGGSPISGTFTNLPNGGSITASYNGTTYTFTANYSGGSGNSLTLTLNSGPLADTPVLPTWAWFTLLAGLAIAGCYRTRLA